LQLTPVPGSPFAVGGAPDAVVIDSSGQFVLTANGGTGDVSVFSIGSGGTLTQVQGSPFASGTDPSAIVIAPANTAGESYVYVANMGGGSISAYSMNMTSGMLTPVSGSPFAISGSPNGLALDPAAPYIYATESGQNLVAGFTINASTGGLTAMSGSPFTSAYALSSPIVEPAGGLLHATAADMNVDCFTISTGNLIELGLTDTESGQVIALAVDGPDNFVYALDGVNSQIEVLPISSGGGLWGASSAIALFPGASNTGANAIAVQH